MVNDEQINSLPQIRQLIVLISELIRICAEKIKSKVLERISLQLDENSEEIRVCNINHLGAEWNLVELIE